MSSKNINLKIGKIVAIGGGELKDFETLSIDREVKKLTGKKKPKALFIGTASGDAVGYFETFKSAYGKKLGCITDHLSLIRENNSQKIIENKILTSDLIYVGGGNTLKMMTIWRKNGVDKLLEKAYKNGIVLSGLSAGAICWFKYGLSDSRRFGKSEENKFNFMKVRGLGFLPFIVSPHHIREKKTRNPGLDNLISKAGGIALALDDNSAFVVEGDTYRIISSKDGSGVRKVALIKGKIIKKLVDKKGTLESLLIL
jgi:dipeptidase E